MSAPCCGEDTIDGELPAPGGVSQTFDVAFDVVGAATVVAPLVDLPSVTAWATLRSIVANSRNIEAPPPYFGVTWKIDAAQGQRNGTETIVWATPIAPVNTVDMAGYIAPGAIGGAGYGAVALLVVGTQIAITVTGVAGFTTRWRIDGEIAIFDGAVLLV